MNCSERSWLTIALLLLLLSPPALDAGVYHDLGRPIVGGWQRYQWVAWDPVLKKDLLWTQESSQDGAVLYALDIDTGKVLEEHDVPAREIGAVMAAENGILYLRTYSGLNHAGNELLMFDPKVRKIERLGLADTPHNRCVGGVMGPDGNVYIGTHQQGRLFRFNVEQKTWKDLGPKVPPPVRPGQNTWLRNLQLTSSGKILAGVVRIPPADVVEIDPASGDFKQIKEIPSEDFRVFRDRVLCGTAVGFDVLDAKYQKSSEVTLDSLKSQTSYDKNKKLKLVYAGNKFGVLATVGMDLCHIDLDAGTLRKLATLPFLSKVRVTSDGRATVIHHPTRRFAVVDIKSGKMAIRTIAYQGKRGTQICGLNKASDGSIYGTNIIGMHLFRHDPKTGQTRDLGHVGWHGGEVYNTIDVAGKIYLGTYGGGHWGVYDPKQPWKPDFETQGTAPNANPRQLGQLGGNDTDTVNRPFEYVQGPGEKVYIASRANYGYPGGSLVAFDPKSGKSQVFRDLKRSIQSVSASDRYVFGGTNMHGGRGSGDRASDGTLFVFDPKKGQRVFEEALVPDAKAVVSVRYNKHDGNVYATTDNQVLFSFDPKSMKLLHTWKIRSPGTPLAGVPEDAGMLHITVAASGDIYGVSQRDLWRLRRKSGKIEYLDPPPIPNLYQIVEGEPGVFYMGAQTHLLKYLVDAPGYYR